MKTECCGTCKFYDDIPFAMVGLCENKDSEYYHCDCDRKEDLCKEYVKKEDK